MASNDAGDPQDVNLTASKIESWHITPKDDSLAKGDCKVILLGRTGGGKSTLGNLLLGRDDISLTRAERGPEKRLEALQKWKPGDSFPVGSVMSTTTISQLGIVDQDGRKMNVVDTPGLFDTKIEQTNARVIIELTRSLVLVSGEPHAMVFVIKLERVTQEEFDAFKTCKEKFGLSHMIVAFSHGENLQKEGLTLEELAEESGFLKQILEEIGTKYVVVSNDSNERKKEVLNLQKKIDEVSNNLTQPWTNPLLKETSEAIQERVKILRQEKPTLSEAEAVHIVREEIVKWDEIEAQAEAIAKAEAKSKAEQKKIAEAKAQGRAEMIKTINVMEIAIPAVCTLLGFGFAKLR